MDDLVSRSEVLAACKPHLDADGGEVWITSQIMETICDLPSHPAQTRTQNLFDALHIESMTREWFAGPHPSLDGYLVALRKRLDRAALRSAADMKETT